MEIKAKELNLKINTICEDFFQLRDYYGQMDIILEYTFFCAINPQLRLKYINETFKLLKEDGYTIINSQFTIPICLYVDNEPVNFYIRPDYLVERDGSVPPPCFDWLVGNSIVRWGCQIHLPEREGDVA